MSLFLPERKSEHTPREGVADEEQKKSVGGVVAPRLVLLSSDSGITGSVGGTLRSGGEQQKSENGSLPPDSPTSGQYFPELSGPRTLGELRRSLSSFHEVSSGGRLNTLAGLNTERPEPS